MNNIISNLYEICEQLKANSSRLAKEDIIRNNLNNELFVSLLKFLFDNNITTGIDINSVLLDCALGENINIDHLMRQKEDRASAYVCFNLPEGIIKSVRGIDEVKAMPEVTFFDDSNLTVGTYTGKMEVKGNRKGPIIVHAADRDQLESVILRIKETLVITVSGSDVNSEIIWN